MSRVAAAGLLVALAAILLQVPGFGYDEARRPAVVLGAALALAGGAFAARGDGWALRFSDLALLALAVSALFAVNRTEAAAALFPAAAAWIFLRATALGWIPRPFLERRGLLILSAIGVLFSGYGVCQFLGGDFLGIGLGREAGSTLGNTNYAGVLSAVFAIAGLASALLERGRRRAIGIAAALLGALHVGASASFGALLGLAAGSAMFAALLVRGRGWKPVALLPLLLVAAAIAPRAAHVAHRASDIAAGEDRTGRIRLGLWKGTLRLVAAHPVLGCGTGNFRMEFPPFRDAAERKLNHEGRGIAYVEAEDPHNSYLLLLAESGPIALIAVLAVLGLALRSGFRRARDPSPEAAALAIAGTAGLIALAVSGMFNSLFGHMPFAVVAAFLAGGAAPVAADSVPTQGRRIAGVAIAAFLAVAWIPWFIADSQYQAASLTNDAGERIAHLQRAVNALPGHWQARFQIAVTWREIGQSEGSARAELRDVLKLHPHSVAALVGLSSDAPAAEEEELLRRAEALAPDYVVVQSRRAGVDLRRRDYASARRRLEKVLETLPDEQETIYTIGRTWLWERKPGEALPWLKRAIVKNPKLRERLADDHPELKADARFTGLLGP